VFATGRVIGFTAGWPLLTVSSQVGGEVLIVMSAAIQSSDATRGDRDELPEVRPVRLAAIAAVGVAVFVALRSIITHGLSGFPVAGPPSTQPGTPGLRSNPTGYDGEFVYRLALDPFTRTLTAHGVTLDDPPYRQQRIATALLAHLVAGLPGVSTALAIVAVNGGAVVVAIVAARYLCVGTARPLLYALVLAVPACLPISLGRDLTEPVAWAGVLVALLAARRGRWFWCAVALTVAALARETSLVVLGGLVLESLWLLVRRRPVRPVRWGRVWLLAPIAVELGWQLWVAHQWHSKLPILLGPGNNSGAPVLGVVTGFLDGLVTGQVTDRAAGVSYLGERIVLVLLMAAAIWALVRRCGSVSFAEGAAAVAAIVVAVSLRNWSMDVQFLRATVEAWGLSVLILVGIRSRWADVITLLAGVATVGVALLYLIWV
jgi:hypothetical protein